MKKLTIQEVGSRGGKNYWKKYTKAQRSKIIKDRWIIRKLNKQMKDIHL